MNDRTKDAERKEVLKAAYRKIEELRGRLAVQENRRTEPVAIVGMGCRFPGGVTDLESFWQLLSSGRDGTSEIPADRWNLDDYYDPDPSAPNKMYVRRGGFIDNIRGFDPLFFHISPLEASSMDPQQRLLLEVSWEALENAGYAPDQLSGSRTGVFVGMSGCDYALMAVQAMREGSVETHTATGVSGSITAGHISYFFGLRGPCLSLDTACSSALTATHLAVESLRRNESTMALVGSVNLIISPDGNIVVCKARMLSDDGWCKTFDASANGYSRSEGCAVLVLKLLSQAEADGDRVLAVIHGTACNQDGRTNGITAPNGNAQREVIQAALGASGLSADDIDYVETHGTGTSLGDPIEVQALGEVFAPSRPAGRNVFLGAVKSNVGHLEATAGMAAIAKAILVLQNEQIPGNLHFHNPNPLIPWESLPFTIPTSLTPWPNEDRRRLAGVSAFGFSGTNVHMIVEQAPRRAPIAVVNDRPCHLLTLSAQSAEALTALAGRYATYLAGHPDANLANICYTANVGRARFSHRLAAVASTSAGLKAELERVVKAQPGAAQIGRAPSQPPQVAWLLGPERLGEVHRQLYHQSPAFKAAIDECNSVATEHFGSALPPSIWTSSAPLDSLPPRLENLLAFSLTYAMATLWRDWGLTPCALSGYGVGLHAAAVQAGALSLSVALRLAVDPATTATASMPLSATQISVLLAANGLPVTADALSASANSFSNQEPLLDPSSLPSAFMREGARVLLVIGAPLVRFPSLERKTADQGLSYHVSRDNTWFELLKTIGSLFMDGVSVDWNKVESPWHRERLALPTYPFQRQDCWLKSSPSDCGYKSLQTELHPLLGRRMHSPQFRDEIVFEAEFDTDRLPFLEDHRYLSSVVVSTSTLLEMANAAGRIVLKQSDIAVDNFVIEQPLLLPDDGACLVQTVLTPISADRYAFAILSADVDQLDNSPSWKRHCSGGFKIATDSPPPSAGQKRIDEFQLHYSEPIDPEWFYNTVREAGMEYGKTFRLLRSIKRSDDGVLARLQVTAEMGKQATAYGIHPGLLDAALQAAGLDHRFSPDQLGSGVSLFMPIAVERFRLPRSGLGEIWILVRVRPSAAGYHETIIADFQFYSTDGEAIGELTGVHFKRNAKKQLMHAVRERHLLRWLFETRWEALPVLPPSTTAQGKWLILTHDTQLTAEFAASIEKRGGQVVLVEPGVAFARPSHERYSIRFQSPDDYDQLLQREADPASPIRGVVFVAGHGDTNGSNGRTVPQLARSGAEELLCLTQALGRHGVADLTALALVTRGFRSPSIGVPASLAASTVWGLGRVIAAELPDLHCRLIDIERSLSVRDAGELLAEELGAPTNENQVALGEGERFGLRLAQADASAFASEAPQTSLARGAVQLEIGDRGDFRQLRFVPQRPQPPGPGEVQLRVLATALNFRDVLNVLGMYPGNPGALGVECVGEIVALGPDVSGWSIGEQVLAIPHHGYCTFSTAPVNMIFRRPPNLTLPDAATLLVAYLTAAYSLCHLGRMKRGDRVLIHAAAGGVGLAAVYLAQRAGAEIFATAGSPAKREYLKQLGVPHVMDSRSLAFVERVSELTAGEGVDLVLNSLTGEAIAGGLSVLRDGGRFLEIGKNELLTDEQAKGVHPTAHYHVIDLLEPFQESPEVMRDLFADITDSLATGTLRPLPHRVFDLSDAPQAFRYMSTARHIGKVIVLDRSAAAAPLLEPSGTYLITGGLGGLGLSVAQWMAAEGARRLILVGRRAPGATAEAAIREIEASGVQVIVTRADVADRQQVAEFLATHTSVVAPLRGVIHAAGVIDDGALLLQDWSRFDRVLNPKIDGTWNLHELTIQCPLDFFVLFSSGAGLFGNPGQASYATGSVFLDELAIARQSAGLPCLSINWGPWADVGMAAAMDARHNESWDSRGLSSIEPDQGLTILQRLMGQGQLTQMAVLPIDASTWGRQAAGQTASPLIANLVAAAGATNASETATGVHAAERLRQTAPPEKRDVLIELVTEIVLDTFGLERSRTIPPDQNLATLGMDSLLAIQLSNRLKTTFDAAVPPTLTFQYPTVESIADYLLTSFSERDDNAPPSENGALVESQLLVAEPGQPLDPQQAQMMLANLDQLSDHEIEMMLRSYPSEHDQA